MTLFQTENFYQTSLIFGVFLFVFAIFVLVVIFLLKIKRNRHNAKKSLYLKQWKEHFLFSQEILTSQKVPKSYMLDFLRLWNHYHESLKGESLKDLNHLGYTLKINKVCQKWLTHFSIRKRIMALITLGNLADKTSFEKISKEIHNKNPLIASMAARSLVKIDEDKAMDHIVGFLLSDRNLFSENISSIFTKEILKNVNSYKLAEPFLKKLKRSSIKQKLFLLEYFPYLPYEKYIPTIREMLNNTFHPEILCRCLKLLKDPRDLSYAKRYLDSHFWFVRLQAVRFLGQVGTKEDLPLLLNALNDSNWWVRYRAAEALIKLPGIDASHLKTKFHNYFLSKRAQDIFELATLESGLTA